MFRKVKNREMRAACEVNKQNMLCYGHYENDYALNYLLG